MLMPTTQNVYRIIKDFSDGRQQYLAAHLFFIEGTLNGVLRPARVGVDRSYIGLSESLFERLTASPAEPFLRGLQELFVNFWGKQHVKVNPDEASC